MKRFIFSSLLTIVFGASLFSQSDFAPVGATWYFDKVEGTSPPHEGYVKIESIKDTIVNDVSAKKLELTFVSSIGDVEKISTDLISQSGDSIFYYRESKFQFMFGFNLNVGDSMLFYGDGYDACQDSSSYGHSKVDSLYSTEVNTTLLNGFYFSLNDSSYWNYSLIIEKIGHVYGFYPRFVNNCGIQDAIPPIGKLRCYVDSSIGQFKYQNIPCDTLIRYNTSLNINKTEQAEVYPTLTSGKINIKSKAILINEIFLLDLNGTQLLNISSNQVEKEMDISSFKLGVYIIKVFYQNNTCSVHRVIKI